MKLLEIEKTNCGWFIRYEHFDWFTLLAAFLLEIIPVYGVITGVQSFSYITKTWEYILSWILIVVGALVALTFLMVFVFSIKDHAFWFTIKEKFFTKITIPYKERSK
ncbi:MAG TPA: hypothetical protein VFC79_01275 [Tissierellaceae bacterium]|nr:hypothetical protein [Tissierellaceae bacterium]